MSRGGTSPRRTRRGRAGSAAVWMGRAAAVAVALTLAAVAAAEVGRLAEPLFFFVGLQGPGAAETARALGLNALVVRLPLDAPERLDEVIEQVRRAAELGLKVIVQLPTNLELEQRVELAHREYWTRLEKYLAAVMPALVGEKAVAAWQTDDYLERAILYSDGSFRRFLQERYGTIEALNEAWGTQFEGWMQVGQAAAAEADQHQPWGIGPASVDLADWKVAEFRGVMRRWAAMVRAYDRRRPLLTGRLSLYRSIAAVPADYDVIVPAIRPDVLEDDPQTGNVHAVDMARRGGRFDVIPALYLPLPPNPLFAEGALSRWVVEAAGHGARGFALDDWERFTTYLPEGEQQRRPLAAKEVRRRLGAVASQIAPLVGSAKIWQVRPRPCYAFLWTPYAGGLEAFKVPAYGFLGGWSPREPSALFFAFRRGCQFGTADYLTPDDIAAVDLDRYGAIFAPHALSVSSAAQQVIEAWANAGGVLVADVGLGMYQAGDWKRLPHPLAQVVGLGQLHSGTHVRGDWQVVKPSPLLPDLPVRARPLGLIDRQAGAVPATERRPRAIDGWLTYALPTAMVDTVAIADARPTPDGQSRLVAGVFSHDYGLGGAVFATFRLWGRWDPADALFAAFHGMLCARRAKYVLAGEFWPGPNALVVTDRGPRLITTTGGVVEVVALGADDSMFAHAYCTTSAAWRLSDGRRAGDVRLLVEAPPLTVVPLDRLPIAVRPYERSCLAHVDVYGPKAIAVSLYGDQPAMTMTKAGIEFKGLRPVPVRIMVRSGEYAVRPGSRHQVTVTHRRGRQEKLVVEADAQGVLDVDVVAAEAKVEIEPAD